MVSAKEPMRQNRRSVMSESETQSPQPDAAHLVLYDGVCGLCNRLLQFMLRHDRRRVFVFAALQGAVGRSIVTRSGGTPTELTTFYVVTDYSGPNARLLTKSDAALFIATRLGWPWKAAGLLRAVPRVIRDGVYNVVARSRYRWFGRYDSCPLPSPESRGRFID
jgi:predicted DCC family thiol-disulfide oxidoreductase YuxK